jgi:hypothetical protein
MPDHGARRATGSFPLDAIETRHRSSHGHQGPSLVDEQNTLDAMITRDPALLQNIHLLPEALFPKGLCYGALLDRPAATMAPILGRLEPFGFHANWTMGLASKRKLVVQTGT